MRSWYVENIGRSIDGKTEHEKFLDYWRAQPGAKGVKHDWVATWRNWMRTAMQRAGTRPTSGAPVGTQERPRYPSAAERAADQSRREYEEAKQAEEWLEANGGDPEDNAQLRAVLARIRSGELGSAPRTAMPYIDGEVINQNGATKEVTSYATGGDPDVAR
jgi:hypothetical protein